MKGILFWMGCMLTFHTLYAQQSDFNERLLQYYERQQYSDAIQLIEQQYPDEKPQKVLVQLGLLHNSLTNYLLAEKFLMQAAASDATDKTILLNLARLSTRKWAYPEALSYYEQYMQIDTMNISVYKAAASLVSSTDTTDRKIRYWERANFLNPLDAEAAKGYASLLSERSEFDPALHVLQTAYAADTNNLSLAASLLTLHYQLQAYDEVVLFGNKLIEGDYLEANFLNMLARAQLAKEQFTEVLRVLDLINEKEQTDFTYSMRSIAYMNLGKRSEALQAIDQAISASIAEGAVGHYRYKGQILNALSRNEEAAEVYLKALQFDHLSKTEAYTNIYYNLGVLQDYVLSKTEFALKNYRQFLKDVADTAKYRNQIEFVKKRMLEITAN